MILEFFLTTGPCRFSDVQRTAGIIRSADCLSAFCNAWSEPGYIVLCENPIDSFTVSKSICITKQLT